MIPLFLMVIMILLFGLCFGSFLNVCICRIPEGKSIVSPASHCTVCGKNITWYDNIPVISYILLGGKCRYCKTRISIQYPLVELLFGIMLVHIYLAISMHGKNSIVSVIYYAVFAGCLLSASVIDLKHYIIPDQINLVGIIVGIAGAGIFPYLVQEKTVLGGLMHSVFGIAVGYGVLRIVVWGGAIIFNKEAMGLGDPKFLAMIGAFLGFKNVLLIIFISSLLGAVIGSAVILLFRKDKKNTVIPYGPFLALGAYLTLFYGASIIDWYWSLLK